VSIYLYETSEETCLGCPMQPQSKRLDRALS
jgi:hypothetical protein